MSHRVVGLRLVAAVAGTLGVLLLAGGVANAAGGAVTISGFAFHPAAITIRAGQAVKWTDGSDPVQHTVTSDTGAFGSGALSSGQTFTVTFRTAGKFAYHCSIHPFMTGSVTVLASAPSPTATASLTPRPTPRPTPHPTPAPTARPTAVPTPRPTPPATPKPVATAGTTPQPTATQVASTPAPTLSTTATPTPAASPTATPTGGVAGASSAPSSPPPLVASTTTDSGSGGGPGAGLIVAIAVAIAAVAGVALYMARRRGVAGS